SRRPLIKRDSKRYNLGIDAACARQSAHRSSRHGDSRRAPERKAERGSSSNAASRSISDVTQRHEFAASGVERHGNVESFAEERSPTSPPSKHSLCDIER